jgi:ABC-type uncharacterized transport system substrate-binding protein
MKRIFRRRFFASQSDNLKSKTCTEPRRSIQNRKWAGLFAIVVALTACGARAEAQQSAGKFLRIGYLSTGSGTTDAPRIEAFRQGLRELGYVEGKNINIEYRYAEGGSERLPELAEELVRLKVDVIVAPGTPAVQAVKQATTTIVRDRALVGNSL